jgi:1-acyl-sn-glycerol-3-phosphate acyltransferase
MSSQAVAADQAEVPARINPVLWTAGRILATPYFKLGLRIRVSGREHVPATGPVVIVANHRSFMDPPLIGYAAIPRRLFYMGKHILFRFAPFGWLIRNLGCFPVVRDSADRRSLRYARTLLDRGEPLVMFPEGTRGKASDGELLPGLPGVALLAGAPGVTVVPCALWDSRRRFGPVHIRFGPPLDLAAIEATNRRERNEIVVGRMMSAIEGLLTEIRAESGTP